jgi:glycosyltransferase involved in cell wall biosynthesis
MPSLCFLLNNDYTADNRVRREAEALIQAGYRVTILCVASSRPEVPASEDHGPLQIRRVFKRRLYKYHALSFRLLKTLLKVLTLGQRFDGIHAHDANMLPLGYALAKLWRVPLVYDSHEYWHALFEEEIERLKATQPRHYPKKIRQVQQFDAFERWALSDCAAVISVSESILARINERSQTPLSLPTLVRNIPEFLPLPAQRPTPFHTRYPLPASTQILLYQGQIAEKRGTGVLIEMMQHLMTLAPDLPVALILMGPILPADEPFYQKIQATLQASERLRDRVFFQPAVPPQEVLPLISGADLGIHPILNTSDNHYFCLPNKLFEYVQAGLPVAVSHFPEMQKIVDQYGLGLTFDPQDPQAMAQALHQVLSKPGQLTHYRTNVLAAKESLSWENEQTALLFQYERIFKGWPSPSDPPVRATMP